MSDVVLGIDIGGSGIKANLVDVTLGDPVGDRFKESTPRHPADVARLVNEIVEHFGVGGPVGCTFPAVVRRGVVHTAANVDPGWIGVDAPALFGEATGRTFTVVNDADAAGVAEMRFGAGRGRDGVVICFTFGTGIGSAVFTHGVLVPNTELGHLSLMGFDSVEDWAAARVKDDEDLSWSQWSERVNTFFDHIDRVFSPDLMILGGGVSRRFDKFSDGLTVDCEVVPAVLRNEAGIVGAALATLAL